jgi:hypothetical protein
MTNLPARNHRTVFEAERERGISEPPQPTESGWQHFGLATVTPPNESLRTATDDWPFLYLRKPMIPTLSLRGMAIMGALALLFIYVFLPRRDMADRISNDSRSHNAQLFFLGAGFMLVETKAVVPWLCCSVAHGSSTPSCSLPCL